MKIVDLLRKESINLNGEVRSKKETIDQMVDLMAAGGNIADVDIYREGVYKREEEGTTGIGEGIAIPHAKTDAVKAPGLAAMVVKEGVDYDSLDGEPVHLIFLIAAPNTEDNVHLEVLSRLSMLLMDDGFRENLMSAGTKEEFLAISTPRKKRSSPKNPKSRRKMIKRIKKAIRFWQSPRARPVSPIPIWRPKAWRTRRKRWATRSKSRPTGQAGIKMC